MRKPESHPLRIAYDLAMRTWSLVLAVALAACGSDKQPETVTSFVQSGYRFDVPPGWVADLRTTDVVTLTPKDRSATGPHILIAALSTVPPAEFKTSNAANCARGFRSVDAIKPAGKLFESGGLHGCVTEVTRSTGRQKRWELGDGKAVFSVACNRDPDDTTTLKLCDDLVAGARPATP
jgi:hypothetical protein